MKIYILTSLLLVAAVTSQAQESTFDTLPGQTAPVAVNNGDDAKNAQPEKQTYRTPEPLRHPFIMCYFVQPTARTGEDVKIPYYVTDFDHSKVRFGDDSKRFDVELSYSADRVNWKTEQTRGVKSGDGEFVLKGIPRGDYYFKLLCRDDKGRVSRTIWHEFRVRDAAELEITEAQTARPTAADLAAAGIKIEADDFFHIVGVDIGDIVPEGNIRDQIKYNREDMAEAKKTLHDSIRDKVTNAVESGVGKEIVAGHPEGYVVFAPAKNGEFIYRAKDWRVIVNGARHDETALETSSRTNSIALTRFLADLAASGKRKVVLPKVTIRLSADEILVLPSNFTVDLGGGRLKINRSHGLHSRPIQMFRAQDAHLVNGILEGQYFEYDYENCGSGNPEHVGLFNLLGDSRYCSVERLEIRNAVGGGTSFGGTWIQKPYDHPQWEVREWLSRTSMAGLKANKPVKRGNELVGGDSWEKGEVEGTFTSPFRSLGKMTNGTYVTVSRFLGYGGMSGLSDYFTIAFYDNAQKFISSEVGFQYHRILIPAGAAFVRVTIEAESLEMANACDMKVFMRDIPRDCLWKNLKYYQCRCLGLGIFEGFNMLMEDIELSHCGDESCRCASDAEDGWDSMQNLTFRRINCHDNPNGDFTVCCGHSFVYENCTMRMSVNQRVHSAVFRDCTLKGGCWDCLTLTRDGYKRFENNTYLGSSYTIGTSAEMVARKKVPTDWELVLADGVFKGESKENPLKIEVGQTGRFRNCTFENCELKGPEDHFTDCIVK